MKRLDTVVCRLIGVCALYVAIMIYSNWVSNAADAITQRWDSVRIICIDLWKILRGLVHFEAVGIYFMDALSLWGAYKSSRVTHPSYL